MIDLQRRIANLLAGADGSRTHRRQRVPPNGFEDREAHRDLSAPLKQGYIICLFYARCKIIVNGQLIKTNRYHQ